MKDVKHFFTSIGSTKRIQETLQKVHTAWTTLQKSYRMTQAHIKLLSELHTMKENLAVFIRQLNYQYALYRDLFQPFLSGVSMVSDN